MIATKAMICTHRRSVSRSWQGSEGTKFGSSFVKSVAHGSIAAANGAIMRALVP